MIIICKTKDLDLKLENYIEDFIKNKNNNKIVAIDFEFNRVNNKRVIGLCQINFKINNKADIFLFYPPNINIRLFEKLLISPNIIKVLHGAESLDIPYLFDHVIMKQNISKFCNNLFDTRYLCEYYNIENKTGGRCRIYELMKQMGAITTEQYNNMIKNDKKLGHIWEIHIDVRNMKNPRLIKYCVDDVEYLPDLYEKFPKNEIYMKIIPAMTQYNYLVRYNDSLDMMFSQISQYNTRRDNDYNMSYNEIYNIVMMWLNSHTIYYILYNINYFKKIIDVIVKNIVYNILDNNIKMMNYDGIKFIVDDIKKEINLLIA
jgi:hypothetical protein